MQQQQEIPTKFLCVCQYGHSRSVCLTRSLHHRNLKAVAAGWQTSGGALEVLCEWADRVLILDSSYLEKIPTKFHGKVMDFHVGPDKWVNPYNSELREILDRMVESKLAEAVRFHGAT